MPDSGEFKIGEDIRDPYIPPLDMVKVPPVISSIVSLPSRASKPILLISFSMSEKSIVLALFKTGTTNPLSVPTATPMLT